MRCVYLGVPMKSIRKFSTNTRRRRATYTSATNLGVEYIVYYEYYILYGMSEPSVYTSVCRRVCTCICLRETRVPVYYIIITIV